MNSEKKESVGGNSAGDEERRLRELLKLRKERARKDPDIRSTGSHVVNPTNKSPAATSTHNSSPPSTSSFTKGESNPSTRTSASQPSRASAAKISSGRSTVQLQTSTPSRKYPGEGRRQQSARGRKRGQGRMDREARRRGEPLPPDWRNHRQDYPHPPPQGRWERDRGPPLDYRRGPPPPDRRGPPGRNEYDYSGYRSRSRSRSPRNHRDRRRRSRSRSASSASSRSESSRSSSMSESRSRSRSHSSSRSGSHSRSKSKSRSPQEGGSKSKSRSDHGSRSSPRRSTSPSVTNRESQSGGRRNSSRGGGDRKRRRRGSSTSSSSNEGEKKNSKINNAKEDESTFSKDQRTIFVSQLVMRATEKEIRRYFTKKVGCKVNEVILLKDKRTGSHKGCAYVQMGRIEDVNKAVSVAGQPPDFQRFPLLVKASEAEKNYVIPASSAVVTASMMGTSLAPAPMFSVDGKVVEAQNVYVGGLDPSVTEEHLFALYSQFGQLEKVSMQMDPASNSSRGYAFMKYRDPKDANLAIQTMSNQVLAGRTMKTGWANQTSTVPGVDVVTSDDLPADANSRAQKAFSVLSQLTGSSVVSVVTDAVSVTAETALSVAMGGQGIAQPRGVPSVAEARANLVAQQAAVRSSATGVASTEAAGQVIVAAAEPSKMIGGLEKPSQYVLVHNMFDKDEETEEGWPKEIKEEFIEECTKFGKITRATVMSELPGGQIYAAFETVEGAQECAKNLAGRWFDKRQLRVDFVEESDIPMDEN